MNSVLFVVSTLRKTGPTHQLLHLCRHLPQFGYQPQVLTLSPEAAHDTMESKFVASGVRHSTVGLSRLRGLFFLQHEVRRAVAAMSPDVIHSQGLRSDQVAAAVHDRIPHVLTVRNSAWHDYPPMFGRIRGSIMAWQHLRVIRQSECPIACSRSLARELEAQCPQISAIPNGVDTDSYTPATDEDRAALRKRLGFSASRPILLHVGSLIERKRPDVLLRSYLSTNLKDIADLVFVGDGPLRSSLQAAAHGHPNVAFTGSVTNVADYLRCASAMVSVSSSEGLPNSVLEALACGLPVALSDIEPHREIGAHDSGAGVLITDLSEAAIAAAVSGLLRQDYAMLSLKARSLAVNSFSALATAQAYAHAYSRLLRKPNA